MVETLEINKTGITPDVIATPGRPTPERFQIKNDTNIIDVEAVPKVEKSEAQFTPVVENKHPEELPHIANLTDGPRTIQGSNFIPSGLNLNKDLAVLDAQREKENIVPGHAIEEEPQTIQNSSVTGITRRDLREAREKVNPWNVPTEVVSRLNTLIKRSNKDLSGIELRNRKTLLLDLVWKIENEADPKIVFEKIHDSKGLGDDEKNELEALVKGKIVSISPVEDVNPEAAKEKIEEVVQPQEVKESLTQEELEKKLLEAEDIYVAESIAYQNALHKQKSLFRKTMSDLGFPGKQLPEGITMQEYLKAFDAQKDYVELLADRRLKMLERGEIGPLNKLESQKLDQKLVEVKESDTERLQEKINEGLPQLEKGIIGKGFEKWTRLSSPKRLAISTALFTGVAFVATPIGLAGAAIGGATRLVRGGLGVGASQLTGKGVDSILKRKSEKRTENANEQYVKATFDRDSIIESEEKMADFLESEKNKKKRGRLIKAAAMVATGAGVSAGLGLGVNEGRSLLHSIHNSHDILPPSGGGHAVADVPTAKPTIEAPVSTQPDIEPVRVELSSKGFIDTFDQLKHDVAAQYPDVGQAPPEVQHILNSSADKLATEYGFYKPGQEFESAFGLKGDHLVLDKSGNLILENAKGSQTIFDAKSGTVHQYGGRMLDAETGKVSPEVVHSEVSRPETTVAETPSEVKAPVSVETATEISKSPFNYSVVDALADTAVVASSMNTNTSPEKSEETAISDGLFVWNGKTVTEVPKDFTPPDLALGKLPMPDRYQFGKEKPDREAKRQYNIAFEKMAMDWPTGTVDFRYPIEYQGGRMQVLQKGENLTVLLNGEKIGSGKLVSGIPNFQYEGPKAKGMLGVKSDYELAFDVARDMVNKKKDLFTTPKK